MSDPYPYIWLKYGAWAVLCTTISGFVLMKWFVSIGSLIAAIGFAGILVLGWLGHRFGSNDE